jgi:hypothetical protein
MPRSSAAGYFTSAISRYEMMKRIIFLIDGFNVYHALDSEPKYHKYKWLDYSALAKCFVSPKDPIVDIL